MQPLRQHFCTRKMLPHTLNDYTHAFIVGSGIQMGEKRRHFFPVFRIGRIGIDGVKRHREVRLRQYLPAALEIFVFAHE